MPGESTEPRAALAPLYTWQDLKIQSRAKETEVSAGRGPRFLFVSADLFKHLCLEVCVYMEKVWVDYLLCQTPGPLPRNSTARVSCQDKSLFELPCVLCWDAPQSKSPGTPRGLVLSLRFLSSPPYRESCGFFPAHLLQGSGGDITTFIPLSTERKGRLLPLLSAKGG